MRVFAKDVSGQKLDRGFKSRPLRFTYRQTQMIQSRFVQSAGKIFEKPSQLIGKFFFVERTGASRREREGNKQIHFESDTRSNAKKRARQEAFLFPACWSGGQRGWCIVDPGAFPCIETMSPTDHLGRWD